MKPRSYVTVRFATLALVVGHLGAGCSHVEGNLEISLGEGGLTVDSQVPARTPYTFGEGLLCTTGGPITIKSVRFNTSEAPESVSALARIVIPPDGAEASPIAAVEGTPERYLAEGNPGRLASVEGLEVDIPCPRDPNADRFVELLVTAEASERGAVIDGMTIRYSSEGKAKELTTRWHYVFCGTATIAVDGCMDDRESG